MNNTTNELKQFLDNAPNVAAWWKDNRDQMERILNTHNASKNRYKTVYNICGTIAVFSSPFSIYSFHVIAQWITAVSVLGMGLAWVGMRKPLMLGSNDRLNPQQDINLEASLFVKAVPLERRKEVLQIITTHSDPSIRELVTILKPLQNLELPDAWWQKLNDLVWPLAVSTPTPTAEQQLQSVFVDIDQQCHSKEQPKTLKL